MTLLDFIKVAKDKAKIKECRRNASEILDYISEKNFSIQDANIVIKLQQYYSEAMDLGSREIYRDILMVHETGKLKSWSKICESASYDLINRAAGALIAGDKNSAQKYFSKAIARCSTSVYKNILIENAKGNLSDDFVNLVIPCSGINLPWLKEYREEANQLRTILEWKRSESLNIEIKKALAEIVIMNPADVKEKESVNELLARANTYKTKNEYLLAEKYFREAISIGSMDAANDLGCMYLTMSDNAINQQIRDQLDKDAFSLFEMAAQSKVKIAYRNLGIMLYSGRGCIKNLSQAIHYLSEADKHGDVNATKILLGIYTEQNNSKLIPYAKKLALTGDADAQCCLGLAYYDSDLIAGDIEQSMYWLACSAKQGHRIANEQLKEIIVEQKQRKTRFWNSFKLMLIDMSAGIAGDMDYIGSESDFDVVSDSVEQIIGICVESIIKKAGDKYRY